MTHHEFGGKVCQDELWGWLKLSELLHLYQLTVWFQPRFWFCITIIKHASYFSEFLSLKSVLLRYQDSHLPVALARFRQLSCKEWLMQRICIKDLFNPCNHRRGSVLSMDTNDTALRNQDVKCWCRNWKTSFLHCQHVESSCRTKQRHHDNEFPKSSSQQFKLSSLTDCWLIISCVWLYGHDTRRCT